MSKKNEQLGMNASTAQGRLVKDLLFHYAGKDDQMWCFHCGSELYREDFSIEHREPWLDSCDPIATFFDLDNISFSHKSCNSGAARKPTRKYRTPAEIAKMHSDNHRKWVARQSQEDIKATRREKYLRTGH